METTKQSKDSKSYSALCADVTETVKLSDKTENKWVTVGLKVREFFGSESAIEEVKAQFVTDAILPAIKQDLRLALERKLPRKGTKDYNVLTSVEQQTWEVINQGKKDARATLETYYKRVLKYAFPKDETETEQASTASTQTKLADLITQAIKKVEKDESPTYDAIGLLASLRASLAFVSVGIDQVI